MIISNLIDRQNAIEAMKNYCKTECYYNDLDWCPECQLDELIKVIEGLPVQKKTWTELQDYYIGIYGRKASE